MRQEKFSLATKRSLQRARWTAPRRYHSVGTGRSRPTALCTNKPEAGVYLFYRRRQITERGWNSRRAIPRDTDAVQELTPRQMGAAIKAARARLEGKTVDGKVLSDRVRGRLARTGRVTFPSKLTLLGRWRFRDPVRGSFFFSMPRCLPVRRNARLDSERDRAGRPHLSVLE